MLKLTTTRGFIINYIGRIEMRANESHILIKADGELPHAAEDLDMTSVLVMDMLALKDIKSMEMVEDPSLIFFD